MGSTQFFTPYGGLLLITLPLGTNTVYFFNTLETVYSLTIYSFPNVEMLVQRILLKSFIKVQNWALTRPFLPNGAHVYYYANNYLHN